MDIKLAGFEAGKKLALIKEIRNIMGMGLKEVYNIFFFWIYFILYFQTKELVEKSPTILKTQVHKLEAEELKTKLMACGAIIEFC